MLTPSGSIPRPPRSSNAARRHRAPWSATSRVGSMAVHARDAAPAIVEDAEEVGLALRAPARCERRSLSSTRRVGEVARLAEHRGHGDVAQDEVVALPHLAHVDAEVAHQVAMDREREVERRGVAGVVVRLDAVVDGSRCGCALWWIEMNMSGRSESARSTRDCRSDDQRRVAVGEEVAVDGAGQVDVRAGFAQESPQVERHARG